MNDYRGLITELLKSGADIEQIIADIKIEHEKTCAFCGGVAEYLCDHVLGYSGMVDSDSADKNGRRYRCVTLESPRHTCDAPMCGECKTRSGIVFFPPPLGGVDTVDLCPKHKRSPCNDGIVEVTVGEAERQRLSTWKMKYMQRFM